ncbi:MAG: hypothetical protein R3B70_05610 [Polyangiaceae bacterium]
MSLFDHLKMATGLGLEPAEMYRRAFEKGVLLGASHFGEAAEMFAAAEQRLAAVDAMWAARAGANAQIYRFLARRDPGAADRAIHALSRIPKIEMPGTADELIDAPKLAAELAARRLEEVARAMVSSAPPPAVADAFRSAAHAWLPLWNARPVTYEILSDDGFADDGTTRFFLNAGTAAMYDATAVLARDPDLAAEHFAMAAQAFGRCGAAAQRKDARERLAACRLERPCWFCGRTVRGLGEHLRTMRTVASSYFAAVAKADRERGEAYDANGSIFACSVCAGAVELVAEARADAVRRELTPQIASLQGQLGALEARIRRIESMPVRVGP